MKTSTSRRHALRALALALSASAGVAPAGAAEKPLKIVVPVDAGSTPDAVARALVAPLAKAAGQPVIVENLPGAGGVLGTAQLVRAPRDGSTLGLIASNHVINPSLYKSIPFDPVKDIAPLTLVASSPFVLVVHKSVPARNLQELVALAKAKPGGMTYGSSGIGTVFHLAGALLESEAGIELMHVPYKGASPMVNDLLGGQVQMAFAGAPLVAPHIASGALKAIGVSTTARSLVLPNVPTLAEQGLKNYDFGGWLAIVAPNGVRTEDIARRHQQLATVLSSAGTRDWLVSQGFTPLQSTPEATRQFLQSELVKHDRLVKQAGATAE